jgi:hypothetical protein
MKKFTCLALVLFLLFAAPLAAQEGGALAYGETVSGTLEPGTEVRWTFDGTEGDLIITDFAVTGGRAMLELHAEAGSFMYVGLSVTDDDFSLWTSGDGGYLNTGYTLPQTGTYTLVLKPEQGRPEYTLTLYEISDMLSEQTVAYGDTVTGELDGLLPQYWTFEGSAGDTAYVEVTSESFTTGLGWQAEGGASSITARSSQHTSITVDHTHTVTQHITLGATGMYTVVVAGAGLDDAGPYTLKLVEISEHLAARPITYGETVEDKLHYSLPDRWTFDGAAGDLVKIHLESATFDALLELRDADGMLLTANDDAGSGTNALINEFSLPQTGTYTIVVTSFIIGVNAAGYTLSLEEISDTITSTSIAYDEIVEMTWDVGAIHRWTFEGTAGEVIFALMWPRTGFDAVLNLAGPDGTVLVEDNRAWGEALLFGVELPVDGEYTLLATGNLLLPGDGGQYWLTIGPMTGDPVPIGDGDTVEGALAQGEMTAYTISAQPGDEITVTYLQARAMPPFIQILDTAGNPVFSTGSTSSSEIVLTSHAETGGDYTLVLIGREPESVMYTLTATSSAG